MGGEATSTRPSPRPAASVRWPMASSFPTATVWRSAVGVLFADAALRETEEALRITERSSATTVGPGGLTRRPGIGTGLTANCCAPSATGS